MRLPRRNVVLAAATAQSAFAAFLSEIASRATEAGSQARDLVSAATPIVHAQIMSGEQATHDCSPRLLARTGIFVSISRASCVLTLAVLVG